MRPVNILWPFLMVLEVALALTSCSQDNDDSVEFEEDAPEIIVAEIPQICSLPDSWPITSAARIIGDGTALSCDEAAVRQAMSEGGFVRFNCGMEPLEINVHSEIEVKSRTIVDGEEKITINGSGSTRIFNVSAALSIRNLRLINGNAKGSDESGGAISGGWRSEVEIIGCEFIGNAADQFGGAVAVGTGSTLKVVSSRFLGNTSKYGGAIYSLWSPLQIVNSVFNGNYTQKNAGGGAIGTDGALDPAFRENETVGGTIEICGSLFQGNQAWGAGGAAFLWVYPPDKIIIDRSTIQGNTLKKDSDGLAMGGGMRVSNGEIVIKASSFLSNSAETHGGGLSLDCEPTCTITNTTFDSNQVTDGFGGAIFGNKLRVNNGTFSRNYASGHGGALFGGEDWVLRNSVFVDNHAGNPWAQAYSCATEGRGDHVLQWVSDFSGAGSDPCIPSVIASNPELASPADNGGPTFTLLPSVKSPVLQNGADCEPVDQRGIPRDTSACDLGAVELPM